MAFNAEHERVMVVNDSHPYLSTHECAYLYFCFRELCVRDKFDEECISIDREKS